MFQENIKNELYNLNNLEDSLTFYLNELINYPPLDKELEYEYAKKIKNGDFEIRKIFIERNLRLVVSVAKKFMNRGLELLDLIEEGNIGLMEALEKYDPSKGYRFSTFAFPYIKSRIRKALLEKSKNIKISTYRGEILTKFYKTQIELSQKLNREPTVIEIANDMNINLIEINKLLLLNLDTMSLDSKIINKNGILVELRSVLKDNKDYENMILNKIQKQEFRDIIFANLTKREKIIIKYRFFNDPILTYQEIGDYLGLSRERVRQIEFLILKKLKESKELNEYINENDKIKVIK